MLNQMPHALLVRRVAATTLCACAAARAQPQNGSDWARVGNAGNRNTIPAECEYLPELQVGSVPYEYRISRTETRIEQWVPFVNAYLTAFPEVDRLDSEFLGASLWVRADGTVYNPEPMNDPGAMMMSWRMAARYCNWLHNDQGTSRAAFERGAYDTSTFTENPDGTYNDQAARSPGARFWMPTRNEWVKAAFYDPDRYGPGQEGYWRAPNGTNEPLIMGLPGEGGQTNAGLGFPNLPYLLPVGSYADVQSPSGLWDLSGGVMEWTESPDAGSLGHRIMLGSSLQYSLPFYVDVPDPLLLNGTLTTTPYAGLRLATVVPCPEGAGLFFVISLTRLFRRTRP